MSNDQDRVYLSCLCMWKTFCWLEMIWRWLSPPKGGCPLFLKWKTWESLIMCLELIFLGIAQRNLIKMILEWFHTHNSKPIDTPIEKGHKLSLKDYPKLEKEKREMARVPYVSAVESLMYAMLCTRPDIYFAVGMVSHYQSNLGLVHWQVVKRIFWYIRGMLDLILCY